MSRSTLIKPLAIFAAAGATVSLVGVALAQGPDGSNLRERLRSGESIPVGEFVVEASDRANAIDADGDGLITQDEMKTHMEARREERRAKRADRRFPDANDDGVVTLPEFLASAEDRFVKLDANSDGQLTEDEMPKRRRRGPGRRGE